MKAKLEIPKGWRRLKVGTVKRATDLELFIVDFNLFWMPPIKEHLIDFNGEPRKVEHGDWMAVIRKVKK